MARTPRRELFGPRFDGARELDRLLRESDTTTVAFCESHGIDRWVLDRVLNGRARRAPDADLVMKIQAATKGRVHLAMWATSSLRDDLPGEVVPLDSESSIAASDDDAA